MTKAVFHPDYPAFLAALKERILHARTAAARAVNRELVLLYWDIGRSIVEKQQVLGWGESVIDRLSADLQDAFPRTTGFSPRNMRDMKRFYLTYSDESIWQQPVAKLDEGPATTEILRQLVAQIPWGHHRLILDKMTDPAARLYYLRATAQLGWSRSVLLNQIKARAYERAVKEKKTHNFALALPEHFAEQADEMMKSRYNLEFLGIGRPMKERELEDRLIERLQHFLLELGYGFCFVGRQYRLALGRKEYFVDLLFYHRFLKALVTFDLKIGPFEPEH
jgi:predicted nuclease of restriction endonuclease-like (RecB) superfamily